MASHRSRTDHSRRLRRRALRLPPLGTLRWWGHIGVETFARGLAQLRLLPVLRRSSITALADTGRAERRNDASDPAEQVVVAEPRIRIDPTPARFDATVSAVVRGYQTTESCTWTLRDARFSFPSGLVTVDGQVPAETLVQRIWPHSYQYAPLVKIGRAEAETVPPGCVFAFPHWNNMYHWLAVMLPLSLALGEETDLPFYVPSTGPRFTAESLAFLGLEDRCVTLGDGIYSCDSLVVKTIPGHGIDRPSPRHVLQVRQELLKHLSYDASARRRLYVSRDDAGDRNVLNEPELVAALGELGFEKVTLGERSFAEQLRVFAEAELVIGAHGAGLANAVVAREGSWLIELVGDKVVNPMYAALASFTGVRYGYVRVADSYRDHVVVVDDVVRAARTALSEITSPVAAKAPT